MAGEEDGLNELAHDLKNDEYPEGEQEPITYEDVDVTIKFKKGTKKDSVSDERVLFSDSGFEMGTLQYDEDKGVLRVPIVLAKEMIYHYDDYDAFRPKEELEAVASYIKGIPVTRGHPEEKLVTDRAEVLGYALDAKFEDDELRAVLEITDKSLVEDIRSGKLKAVSPGHFSRLDKTSSGEYEGKHYDVTQRDIFVDHIAIVEEGRCSVADGCGIVIDEEVRERKYQKKKEEVDEGKRMVSKTVLGKLDSVLELAGKLDDKTVKVGLDELKKMLTEEPGKKQEGDEGALEREKALDAAMKQVEAERDGLKVDLDAMVAEEKTKLVDELKLLQDVKTEEDLKRMSLDALKSDLELVQSLTGSKFTTDDDGRAEGGNGAIRGAYKEVGRKGGKK